MTPSKSYDPDYKVHYESLALLKKDMEALGIELILVYIPQMTEIYFNIDGLDVIN